MEKAKKRLYKNARENQVAAEITIKLTQQRKPDIGRGGEPTLLLSMKRPPSEGDSGQRRGENSWGGKPT